MWLCSSCQKVVFFSTPWMWASFATCFAQWDISKCDASTYLKSAWACQFALASSSWNLKPSCKHANKPELACQMEEGTCPVTAMAPTPKDSHLADWQLTSGAQVSPAGPSIWAQPRLQAPELGTNEMAMALLKPPDLGCLFHRMSCLIYLPSFLPLHSFSSSPSALHSPHVSFFFFSFYKNYKYPFKGLLGVWHWPGLVPSQSLPHFLLTHSLWSPHKQTLQTLHGLRGPTHNLIQQDVSGDQPATV